MATRSLWVVAGFLFSVPVHLAPQGVSTVEIENVQLARSLAAVVQDEGGRPMEGVFVEEFNSDWKDSLRSTKTDAVGAFTFSPVTGREVYYFQLRMEGFDPLRLRVKVNRKRGKELKLQMVLST